MTKVGFHPENLLWARPSQELSNVSILNHDSIRFLTVTDQGAHNEENYGQYFCSVTDRS